MPSRDPLDVAGLLSPTEAREAAAAVDRLAERDRTRLEAARAAFECDEE